MPDVFVVKGFEPGLRRTYQLWVEGAAPNVVIEVTSRATRKIDEGRKPEVYAKIGAKELFLYDPTCDYLNPPLRGYRLQDESLVRVMPDAQGMLASEELDAWLTREGASLVLIDRQTNDRLQTRAEVAESRASAAEEELARLREELRRRSGN